MAKINGIVLLHKRYTTADWANHVLQAGELGLDLTTKEVRIGTASDQAWANASPVSCKVVFTGEGKHITDVTYNNGVVTVTKGTISYNDLANKPALNFDAAGTAASAVSTHNAAADAHADIRQKVTDNTTAINTEKQRAEGKEGELATAISNEETRAKKAEGDLQTAVNAKVAQADYDTKVAALEKADTDLDTAVKAEATTRGQEITRVEGLISTEKGRVDTLVDTTIPGINTKVKANEDAIKALEGLASSGLSRLVVTELPAVDSALENVIYMILRSDNKGAENGDIYDEYLIMGEEGNKRFELLGNTAVDLTDYAKSADVEADIKEVADDLAQEVLDREAAIKEIEDQIYIINGSGEGSFSKEIRDEIEHRMGVDIATKEELTNAVSNLELSISTTYDLANGASEQAYLNQSSISTLELNVDGMSKQIEEINQFIVDDRDYIQNTVLPEIGNNTNAIAELDNAITTINGDEYVEGSIKYQVAAEATLREEADSALEDRIAELEKVEYTGDGMVEVSGTTISHKKSDTTTSADFGFFAFKVDEYGHITGIQAITTLDGNA